MSSAPSPVNTDIAVRGFFLELYLSFSLDCLRSMKWMKRWWMHVKGGVLLP